MSGVFHQSAGSRYRIQARKTEASNHQQSTKRNLCPIVRIKQNTYTWSVLNFNRNTFIRSTTRDDSRSDPEVGKFESRSPDFESSFRREELAEFDK